MTTLVIHGETYTVRGRVGPGVLGDSLPDDRLELADFMVDGVAKFLVPADAVRFLARYGAGRWTVDDLDDLGDAIVRIYGFIADGTIRVASPA